MTWNGEEIVTSEMGVIWAYSATLANYDPTPIDSETPARGKYSRMAMGDSPMIAAAELIQQLYDEQEGPWRV